MSQCVAAEQIALMARQLDAYRLVVRIVQEYPTSAKVKEAIRRAEAE